jgi:putative hydrolase of the HAD superfamily
MKRALLFDLDDTLVVEEPAAAAAFLATAQVAVARHRVQADRLALAARERARELWYATPAHPYCLRVGISSWEGLWCRFEGEQPDVRWLREWSPRYRREAWSLALAEQGVHDPLLAEELGERYGTERRARHDRFADVPVCLAELRDSYKLALVTNGASCLQREKLTAAGLGDFFDVVAISGEFGVGKPEPSIFEYTLALLGSDREHAVMVGDSLARDVDGAIAAGLRAVWVNRSGSPRPEDRPGLVEITTLSDLRGALQALPS